jgi:hypothetical protein
MYSGSAKIVFKTLDISELVPAVATSVGAIVVHSNKGDVDAPVLITNKAQFIQEYGKPEIPTDYTSALQLAKLAKHAAIGFLQNGRVLYAMRARKDSLYGGLYVVTSGSSEINAAIVAGQSVPGAYVYGTDQCLVFFGADPGTWNNNIKIVLTTVDAPTWKFRVDVYYVDDAGVTSLVETFNVSRKRQLDGYGNQTYIKDVINGRSAYIRVEDNALVANTVMPRDISTALSMAQGSNDTTMDDAAVVVAWDVFTNILAYSINILINGGLCTAANTVHTKMKNIAEARVDCTCVLDVPYADLNSVANQVTWRTGTQNLNTSFTALYSPWIKVFDEYNGQVVAIPASGDIAGVYALTDYIYGAAHGAPAGYNRGILGRALQLCFGIDLTKKAYTTGVGGEMDVLDAAQINPIINDPGFGIVVFGEETEQALKSALSNVHIRRLINQIAVETTRASKNYLFEPLIDRTYFRVRTALEQYMASLEGLGAFDNVTDRGWKVVCDATNNSATDRDNNQLNVWLFIKPVKVAKYIEIKAIITRSTASFEAIIAAGTVL